MASQGQQLILILLLVGFTLYCLALEYERNHNAKTLQPFFDSSIPNIRHPEVQAWGKDLILERERLHSDIQSTPE